MTDWTIGISTGLFYDKNFFDCIPAVKQAGFSVIEICSSPDHLDYHSRSVVEKAAHLLDELQLTPYSFHAPFGDSIDITALESDRREHARREIFQAIEAAGALHAKHFVFHPGPENAFQPPKEQRLQRMENAIPLLDQIHDKCREEGTNLLLENMLPHLFGGNVQELLWVIGSMNALHIGTCLDTGHAYLAGILRKMTHKLSSTLRLIHANDNKGNHDDHLPPPAGHIDWPRFMHDLQQTDFRGVLMLELSPQQQSIEDNLQDACAARQYLRSLQD